MPFEPRRLGTLFRYYQAGLANMAFGYGLFALFVHLGLNAYLAQICSHLLGMAFNYFTYSRHVFRGSAPAKLRFFGAYVFNYFVGLAAIAGGKQFIHSDYLVGIFAIIVASLANYFVLRHAVFRNWRT